ncbi:hypothetical protein GCM10027568_26320 [Humibacter soli]
MIGDGTLVHDRGRRLEIVVGNAGDRADGVEHEFGSMRTGVIRHIEVGLETVARGQDDGAREGIRALSQCRVDVARVPFEPLEKLEIGRAVACGEAEKHGFDGTPTNL